MNSHIPRRTFLKGIFAASALSAMPSLPVFAKTKSEKAPASSRVNLACVGIGNRGADDVEGLMKTGLANLVALCDVDMGAKHTQKILQKYPDVPRFQDFRQMLDKMGKHIDAVSVGTPDFSHFPITMMAMTMGKHVYVEKPMAHTFQECELMMQAEKKYKVAAQMGNQGHSGENYFQFKAWTEAGIIKDVTRIVAHMNSPRRWHGWHITGFPPAEPIPSTLDWDKWLTTAPFRDFNHDYVNGQWRCWYEFGNGALGDWGAHILDTAHEFLDLGLPEQVNAVHEDGPNPFIFPQASTLSFHFPSRGTMPPVEVFWYDGVKNAPPLPKDFGDAVYSADVPPPTSGKLEAKLSPGKEIYSKELVFKGGSHSSPLQIVPKSKMEEMKSKLPRVEGKHSDHYKNFLLACKGEEKCRSNFAVAGPLSQLMVMGVIAQRLNTKLTFDRATKQFTDNKVANDLLVGPPPRKGWEQYYKV